MLATARSMSVKDTQYIFPPRAQDSIPLEEAKYFAKMGWYAQLKYNDTRCLFKYCANGKIELWTRHAERIRNYNAPDWLMEQLETLRDRLHMAPNSWTLLDGGVLDTKHVAIKDVLVIWDILVYNGTHLLGSTYRSRYDFLFENLVGGVENSTTFWYTNPQSPKAHEPIDFGIKITDNILMPRNYLGNRSNSPDNDGNPDGDAWQSIWDDMIMVANAPYTKGKPGDKDYSCHPVIEGLVMKSLDGKLEIGMREKNNSSWMIRSRVKTGRSNY